MKKLSIIILGSIVLILVLGLSIYTCISQPKMAYIQVQGVYNDFEYKKELESKYEYQVGVNVYIKIPD